VEVGRGGAATVREQDPKASGLHEVPVSIERTGEASYRVTVGGLGKEVFVWGAGDRRQVFVDGEVFELDVGAGSARPRRGRPLHDELLSPMPAKVREVLVAPGQKVAPGDVLVKLEAMKMELVVRAPTAGSIVTVNCRAGELVAQGARLLEMEEDRDERVVTSDE
jgi:acetyl/propionyl-CoA carboxylase alpha subunit